MSNTSQKSMTYAIVVLVGCVLFLAMTAYVAYRIYDSFKDSGVPVWSGGKVIATLDPTHTVLSFVALAILALGLVAWRTWRSIELGFKVSRK